MTPDALTPSSAPAAAVAARRRGWPRELAETAGVLGLGVAAAALVHTVALQPFTIPSGSMAPGLLTGDYIVVDKAAYGWSRASPPWELPWRAPGRDGRVGGGPVRRGDVVVFRRPHDPSQVWVKRVVGLAGDRVRLADGVVEVNGRPWPQRPLGGGSDADDPARPVRRFRETGPDGRAHVVQRAPVDGEADTTDVHRVPPGSLFVLGDNRDNSADSRFPADQGVGDLPVEDVLGRVRWVLWSWRPDAALLKPWTWLDVRPGRLLQSVP